MYTRRFVGTNPTDEPVSAAHRALCSRSRYDSAYRFAAANSLRRSMVGQTNRQSSTITPVLIPSLRTVYTVVQFRNPCDQLLGIFAGFQPHVTAPFTKGVK